MPLTYSRFAILILLKSIVFGNGTPNSTTPTATKAILDLKRRNDLVDEAFLEQKDILLDMLEAKLKEVRDKKKKKSDQEENGTIGESSKCELLPADVDLKLQANGIVAVGETDVQLKFGNSGSSNLHLNSSGISNVGKANLELDLGDGTVNIPGLRNLFLGSTFVRGPCESRNVTEPKIDNPPVSPPKDTLNDDQLITFRRSMDSNIVNSIPSIESPITEPIPNNASAA
ncbi:uncharacterized protein LOC120629626 [Pararge aegeria]|nr:uncharacterized protein LOC120629626 [Pararge aegeria]